MTTTILILAANPTDTARLRLDEEVREIKSGLNRAKNREQFEVYTEGAVRSQGLRQAMLDHSPNIVHFCGHGGGKDGIVLEDNQGNTHHVQTDALADLFELFNEDKQIECVVLNACYSEVQARAIARHIPYVIGMNKAIGDKAAIEFSVSFYDAIGAGKSIEFAYKLGRNAIKMAGIPESLTPVLKKQGEKTATVSNSSSPLNPLNPSSNTHTKTVTLLNANTQQQPDGYVIGILQNVLQDNGYSTEIPQSKRSLRIKAQNSPQAKILFQSALSPVNEVPENINQEGLIIIRIGDNPNDKLGEKQNTELSAELSKELSKEHNEEQTVFIWQSPKDDEYLVQQVLDSLKNPVQLKKTKPKPKPKSEPIRQAPEIINQPDLWLTFLLEQQDDTITARWLESETEAIHNTPATKLLPYTATAEQHNALSEALLGDSNNWQKQLQQKLQEKNIHHWQDANIHIRIMTNDHQLAMIPWQQMEVNHDTHRTIEVGPQVLGDQSAFLQQNLSTPLLIIPAGHDFRIGGDRHYRVIQEYLNGYLDIHGTIPRVYSPDQLKREIGFQQPDILYLYAKCENGKLLLDSSYNSDGTMTLETLANWLEAAQIRPLIIISLIGKTLSDYPETLVKNSKMLWIQQARSEVRQDDLSKNLTDVFEGLAKEPHLGKLIQQSRKNYALTHHYWVNGRPLTLNTGQDNIQRSRQLRAALLKIMLGRRELKERMFSEITRSEVVNSGTLLTYVITGNEMSCPFDFPAQLQQRLHWDDSEHYLPVIPFYFHITLDAERDPFETFDIALSQGILHGSNDIGLIFQEELEQRGLQNQECCISLNWLIQVPKDTQQQIKDWLPVWTEILCQDFSGNIPESTVLISAACLQIMDAETSGLQKIQNETNRLLRQEAGCPLRLIRIREALGKLQADEIEDFFLDNDQWREDLQLEANHIDPYDYSEWVIEQTDGEFDDTIRLIWQQYQQSYNEYLERRNI